MSVISAWFRQHTENEPLENAKRPKSQSLSDSSDTNSIFAQSLFQNLNQVAMPEPTLVLRYGVAILATVSASLVMYILRPHIDISVTMLIFLLVITANAVYGGLLPGIVATAIATAVESIFFPSAGNVWLLLAQLTLFFCVGTLLSYIVDRLRNTVEVSQMRQSHKILQKKYADLEAELATATEEIKARDEFLSIASHELKTPLTSMLLQLQIALQNIRTVSLANFSVEDLMRMLENAEEQITRLSKMINDLLNVSLITTGRMDLEKTEMDLSDAVRVVFDGLSEQMIRGRNQVDLALEENITGYWDKIRIEQVVTNLLTNALKYGDSNPINIRAWQDSESAKLEVRDHGIGIPQDVQKKIFSRFERGVDDAKFKGLGVGLYIARQIVLAHNGKITVKSKPNNGTTFLVELPIAHPKQN